MRVNAAHTQVQWNNEMISRVVTDREVAELWMKGDSDFDSLDDVDKQRLIQHETGSINMWEYIFSLHQQNLLSDTRWQQLSWNFKTLEIVNLSAKPGKSPKMDSINRSRIVWANIWNKQSISDSKII